MKKILLVIMVVFVGMASFAQQRSAKDLEKMFKGLSDIEAIMAGQAFQEGNIYKTLLLTDATPNLNDIERKLLADYAQVALMCNIKGTPMQCYFVKDSEDKRGIVGLDGQIIVTPMSGTIVNIPNGKDFGIVLVGELSRNSPSELIQEWGQLTISKENNILGLFSAIIVDADKLSIHSLLPMDEYIFLSLGSKGNGKFDIFTLKAVGDDALWGIVDMKGKQVLPNEYTGFTRSSHLLDTNNSGLWGKWVGTTDMDMAEALNYSKDLRAATIQRRKELAGALNDFGEAMIATGESIEEMQAVAASSPDEVDGSTNGTGNSDTGGKHNNMSEQRSYNSDKSTYSKYDSMLSQVFAGNREASPSEIKQWQKKMKELREKWEAKGKSFPHSANEGR